MTEGNWSNAPQVNTKEEVIQDIRMESIGCGHNPGALMPVYEITCVCCLHVILSFGSFISLEVGSFVFFLFEGKEK